MVYRQGGGRQTQCATWAYNHALWTLTLLVPLVLMLPLLQEMLYQFQLTLLWFSNCNQSNQLETRAPVVLIFQSIFAPATQCMLVGAPAEGPVLHHHSDHCLRPSHIVVSAVVIHSSWWCSAHTLVEEVYAACRLP